MEEETWVLIINLGCNKIISLIRKYKSNKIRSSQEHKIKSLNIWEMKCLMQKNKILKIFNLNDIKEFIIIIVIVIKCYLFNLAIRNLLNFVLLMSVCFFHSFDNYSNLAPNKI